MMPKTTQKSFELLIIFHIVPQTNGTVAMLSTGRAR